MRKHSQPLLALTAGDLMSRNVVLLTESMPLRDAARLLQQNQVGGAPVVDDEGRCVGVFSAADFLRLAVKRADIAAPASAAHPFTCPFQTKQTTLDGQELISCALPPEVCPIQVQQQDAEGKISEVSGQPQCVLAEWQVVQLETLPADAVRTYMTANPVTVGPGAPIRFLTRQMMDAHIHRIIVVDEGQKPVGIVSSTDVLAAVAYAEDKP